ncbi:alpha-N-acetylglucosaminidase N-terminal domain-containing protein, partial [Wenyingzhuangia sp. chi5]
MKKITQLLLWIPLFIMIISCGNKEKEIKELSPSELLISRVLPNYSEDFEVEVDSLLENDWFEIVSKGDKILLRGNNGVSIASALYYYLKEYA